MLKFLHNSFMGKQLECYEKINDISNHEFVVLVTLTIALLIFGILPNTILGVIQ